MRPVHFVALGDSLTEGVGDPVGDRVGGCVRACGGCGACGEGHVGDPAGRSTGRSAALSAGCSLERADGRSLGHPVGNGWRGWAALLAGGLVDRPAGFTNLAASGAQTRDVLETQLPAALALKPDVAAVVIGVNDTLRATFDIRAVAARLDQVYAAFTERGTTLLTVCLPDPGTMLGLPGALADPLARRQRAVNTVVHALSERYGAVHLHAAEGAWTTDRAMWSADRLHPSERGHRQLALRSHALLTAAGVRTGPAPSAEPEFPVPTRSASVWWLATAGTAWVVRRCRDLLPQLLRLAVDELRHRARGTSARLDLRAAQACSAALAALPVSPVASLPLAAESPEAEAA